MSALAYNDRIDEDESRYPKAHQELPQSFYEAALDVTNTIETIRHTAERDTSGEMELSYRKDRSDGGMDTTSDAQDEATDESTG